MAYVKIQRSSPFADSALSDARGSLPVICASVCIAIIVCGVLFALANGARPANGLDVDLIRTVEAP